jgi:inhibitor of KinA
MAYFVIPMLPSYVIFPLGDSAMTLDLGNCIDEQHNIRALRVYDQLTGRGLSGVYDIIAAYSSVTVFFDPTVLRREEVQVLLEEAWRESGVFFSNGLPSADRVIHIPVCYEGEYAPDIEWVAREKGMTSSQVVEVHVSGLYRVYMIGFLPGFSYMGTVDERLQLPRKRLPVPVVAGGVGIAGQQTGIYPLNSPGGWQIIGRTPVRQFDVSRDPPVLLRAGDQVQFHAISFAEFRALSGRP